MMPGGNFDPHANPIVTAQTQRSNEQSALQDQSDKNLFAPAASIDTSSQPKTPQDFAKLAAAIDPFRCDPNNPTVDTDGDGLTNLEEYLAGTDPLSAQGALKLAAVLPAPGSVSLQFLAISNRTYSVMYRTALSDPAWLTLTNVAAQPANRPGRVVSGYLLPEPRLAEVALL